MPIELPVTQFPDRMTLDVEAFAAKGKKELVFVGTFKELRAKGLSIHSKVHGHSVKQLPDSEPPAKVKKTKAKTKKK